MGLKNGERAFTDHVDFAALIPGERGDPLRSRADLPHDFELPILIPNLGKVMGWRPWHYDGKRKVRKATSAVGGAMKSGADIDGVTASEFQ